ncbi:hypothetical protein H7171_00600 [Candidatus Saccharibacteria bacterium]|nr:hypothetical protein [Candidatus Saccharibacteria bacterium]
MTTIEQLAGITSQHNEIIKRVGNGSLDPLVVKRALQDIIEGKLPVGANWNLPTWWRTPKQQLARVRQLWPNAVLPQGLPKEFTPRTKSEVLLLHVPDSFDSLWDKVDAPQKDGVSYTKYRLEGVKDDKRNLRLSPNKREFTQPVWLAFDPERGRGARPDSFWGQADTAASEVFSALIQFPEWSLAWFNGASAPNLTGYQLKYDGSWSRVPYLNRWVDDRRLGLLGSWAGYRDGNWSSPSVRGC